MKMKFGMFCLLLVFVGFVGASTQSYEIEISMSQSGDESNLINIDVVSPDSGLVDNPIIFDVEVNYVNYSDVECVIQFDIDGKLYYPGNNLEREFDSGTSNWEIECYDSETSNFKSGSFKVFDYYLEDLDYFYFNDSDINGMLEHQGDSDVKLYYEDGVNSIYTIPDIGSDGEFVIPSSEISSSGKYSIKAITNYYEESDLKSNEIEFYVGYASAKFEESIVNLNIESDIELYIDLGGLSGAYNLFVSEVNKGSGVINSGSVVGPGAYEFGSSNPGTFYLELSISVIGDLGSPYSIPGLNTLTVNSAAHYVDDEEPEITLVYPKEGDIIGRGDFEEKTDGHKYLDFRYTVTDDVDIEECEFRLYNATFTSGIYDYLNYFLYTETETNFGGTSRTVDVTIRDFDERGYVWEVICEDSAGNSQEWFNYFEVDYGEVSSSSSASGLTSYEREEEVKNLMDEIDKFLEQYNDFGLDERNVIEILKIDEEMRSYEKKLNQFDQDLKYNLKYMDEEKRINRVNEIDEEINEIEKNVVLGISVSSTYEFSKSRPDVFMEEIIEKYFDAKGENIKTTTLKLLGKSNDEIQDMVSVKAEVFNIEIEYLDETKELVLVKKDVDVDVEEGVILEIIDSNIIDSEITFVSSGVKDIGQGIWEIEIKDSDEIIYYFYDDISLQKIEKTESVLFSEVASENANMITGFVVAIGDNGFSIVSFLIGFLFLGYAGYLVVGKARLESWKKNLEVSNMLNTISKTKNYLRGNDVENARDNYHQMSEIYKTLPLKTKNFFFKEIKIVKLAIDKKDVLNLVKEYEKSRREFRKDDAVAIHSKINEIYKKLPKKFQERIYRRLVKGEFN